MFWARKLNELPACSKKIQNSTLKAKMISIAMAMSRRTAPSRKPSRRISTHSATNSAVRSHCSWLASMASRK